MPKEVFGEYCVGLGGIGDVWVLLVVFGKYWIALGIIGDALGI